MKKANIYFGFTLAEVLITLGIIGVVVAMTIPTLYSQYQAHANIVKLKKVYSILKEAHDLVTKVDQPTWHPDYLFSSQIYAEAMVKHLKVVKTCGSSGNMGNCWPLDNYYLTGASVATGTSQVPMDMPYLYGYQLADGTLIYFYVWSVAASIDPDKRLAEVIAIDVNGFSGPNMWGADQFFIYTSISMFGQPRTTWVGAECSYKIMSGETSQAVKAAGSKSFQSYTSGATTYNRCGEI